MSEINLSFHPFPNSHENTVDLFQITRGRLIILNSASAYISTHAAAISIEIEVPAKQRYRKVANTQIKLMQGGSRLCLTRENLTKCNCAAKPFPETH